MGRMTVSERASFDEDPKQFELRRDEARGLIDVGRRAEVWDIDRSHYQPEITLVRDDAGRAVAAALTSARPHTATRKIVDVLAPDAEARHALAEAVVQAAREEHGLVSLKWEWHPWALADGAPEIGASLGFRALEEPFASIPSTLGSVRGGVLWLHGDPGFRALEPVPYYGQTTDFTCGAVSLIMALQSGGDLIVERGGDAQAEANRVQELALWRQATNMPACEPVGLAVAASDWLRPRGGVVPEVHISTDRPILLDGFGDDAAGWRELLQRESWRRDEQLGVPVVRDWVGIETIFARVTAGSRALLLIDERPMHGDDVPHWVFMYAVAGEVAVIQDPWVDASGGETWVDAAALAMSRADVDLMVRYEQPSVRGVIFLG